MSDNIDAWIQAKNEKRQAQIDELNKAREERERKANAGKAVLKTTFDTVIEPFFIKAKKKIEADEFKLSFSNIGTPTAPRYQYTVTANGSMGVTMNMSFYSKHDTDEISVYMSYKRGTNSGNEPYTMKPEQITETFLERVFLTGMNQAFM